MRRAVAWAMWSVSAVVIAALAASLMGLTVPNWLQGFAGWYAAVVGGISMMLGMGLVWTLPKKRRYVALACEAFVLVAGVVLVHRIESGAEWRDYERRLVAVQQSAEYIATKARLAAELNALASASGRTFSQDYRTAFRENEAARDAISDKAGPLTTRLTELEAAAGPKPSQDSEGMSGWKGILVAVLLCLAYEGTALVLMGAASDAPTRRRASAAGETPRKDASAEARGRIRRAVRRGEFSPEEYEAYRKAYREHQATGRGLGYRDLCKTLGWAEKRTQEMGRLIKAALESDGGRQ